MTYRSRSKRWSQNNGMCFVRMDSEIVSGKFSFHIDTGNHPPICCKPPRYIPRESEFMQEIVESLDANGMAEEDNGT